MISVQLLRSSVTG